MSMQPCLPFSHRKRRWQGLQDQDQDQAKEKEDKDQDERGDQPFFLGPSSVDEKNPTNSLNDSSFYGIQYDDIKSMDASEYLQRVAEEASQLPDIFIANSNKQKNNDNNENVYMNRASIVVSLSSSYKNDDTARSTIRRLQQAEKQFPNVASSTIDPSLLLLWMKQSINNFISLRTYLDTCIQYGIGGKESQRILLPPMKDQYSWYAFCGIEYNKKHHQNVQQQHEHEVVVKKPSSDNNTNGYLPTVSLLLQMDQVMTRRVISHLAQLILQLTASPTTPRDDDDTDDKSNDGTIQIMKLFDDYDSSSSTSSSLSSRYVLWMYALLTRLEKPIHCDDAAVLYSIYQKLLAYLLLVSGSNHDRIISPTQQQNQYHLQQVHTSPIKLLIVIIGIFFEQDGGFHKVRQHIT